MTRMMLDLRLFAIRLGSYTFSPKLIPTVVTLLLLTLLYSLGQWQLSRAHAKDTLKQQIESRRLNNPIELDLLPTNKDDRQYVPVTLTGHFNASKSFLLDNKVMNMNAGFNVVAPFELESGGWVLVNRGWIPRTRYRADLPKFDTPEKTQTLTGFVRTPYDKVFMLQEQQYDIRQWPVIIQSINIGELEKVIDVKFASYVVKLDKNSAAGFDRDWPALKLDSSKHIGYAVQWFGLFAALLSIYFIVNTKRTKNDE
jgi:surfeit locus 1 family protein